PARREDGGRGRPRPAAGGAGPEGGHDGEGAAQPQPAAQAEPDAQRRAHGGARARPRYGPRRLIVPAVPAVVLQSRSSGRTTMRGTGRKKVGAGARERSPERR